MNQKIYFIQKIWFKTTFSRSYILHGIFMFSLIKLVIINNNIFLEKSNGSICMLLLYIIWSRPSPGKKNLCVHYYDFKCVWKEKW
jgi:hypothetical protein